jgi:hypothetical protein
MVSKLWILIDIGCLCCDEASEIVGIYKNKEEAIQMADTWQGICNADNKGQHDFIVRELPDVGVINPKYE